MKKLFFAILIGVLFNLFAVQQLICQDKKILKIESISKLIVIDKETLPASAEIDQRLIAAVQDALKGNSNYLHPDATASSQGFYEYDRFYQADSICRPALEALNDTDVKLVKNIITPKFPNLEIQEVEVVTIKTDTSGHIRIEGHQPPANNMHLQITWTLESNKWVIGRIERQLW